MKSYIGCLLFGLVFVGLNVQAGGAVAVKLNSTVEWMHAWAPFSYILLAIVLVSPMISLHLMASWPRHIEPESPMARFRRGDDVMED